MDGLKPVKEEGHSQPLGEDTKQGMLIDSKDDVKPKEEAKTAMAGDFFHVDSKNVKMELKTEQDFLDSLVNAKILEENLSIKSDVITAGGDAGAADFAPSVTPSEKTTDCYKDTVQDSYKDITMLKEGNIVAKDVQDGVDTGINQSSDCGSTIPLVEETIIEDPPCLSEAANNKTKKPRYKKRKKPPPFIGPQRPIQFEDLEDIMNGVYDLHFDTLDTDEEPPVLSSSNESCNSSDSEGWLVESGDEAGSGAVVGGCQVTRNNNKNLELVKTRLEETKAAKDRLGNTINFVGAETNVAALDATVREMVSAAEPQIQAGLDALTALAAAPIAALSLIKHTHLLETAALLCRYTPPTPTPSANRTTRSTEPEVEQAIKITSEAEHILGRMMSLLNVQVKSDFWPAVEDMVKKFAERTKDMATDRIYLLTEYPEDDVPTESASSTLPKIYPMMSIDDRRDMEGFADDESDPEQVPVLKAVVSNKQTGRKPKRRKTATGKDKNHKSDKKMKENQKKSKLVQKKSSIGRTGTSDLKDPTFEPLMSDAELLQSSESD